MNYDKSTGEGQKRMFYESHRQVADSMHEKMAKLAYDKGYTDAQAGKEPQIPGNTDYMAGHTDGQEA